jgi:hypothetical protein
MHGRRYVGLVAAAALFASLPAASHGRAVSTLTGTVGPAHTIALRTAGGALVRNLQPGKYRIVVRDRSSIHNFHLFGGGVNKSTGVAFKGTATWTVTLRNGTAYSYRCDPHRSTLRGTFRAGRAASPPSPVPPVVPPPTTPPPGGYDPSPYP